MESMIRLFFCLFVCFIVNFELSRLKSCTHFETVVDVSVFIFVVGVVFVIRFFCCWIFVMDSCVGLVYFFVSLFVCLFACLFVCLFYC